MTQQTAARSGPGFFKKLFTGRLARLGYLGRFLILLILGGLLEAMATSIVQDFERYGATGGFWFSIAVGAVFWFGFMLMAVSITWRRLHDLNLPGWYAIALMIIGWLSFIPRIGIFFTVFIAVTGLALLFVKGTVGPNNYGPGNTR